MFRSFQQLLHHYFEFIKRHLTVAVLVYFGEDLEPDFLADLSSHSEHFFDLIDRDGSASVLVVEGKGLFELFVL